MKNKNWINIVWAGVGFAMLGYGIEHGHSSLMAILGYVILSSWLLFIFISYYNEE